MKKIELLFAAAIIMGITTACNGKCGRPEGAAGTSKEVVAATETPTMTGTFEGLLPAADCEGIRTTLTVNADSTYTLRSEYIGVKDGLFETSGVYHLIETDLIELVTPSSGEKTYYKRLENGFMLSDSIGTVNTGELAEHYVLKPR